MLPTRLAALQALGLQALGRPAALRALGRAVALQALGRAPQALGRPAALQAILGVRSGLRGACGVPAGAAWRGSRPPQRRCGAASTAAAGQGAGGTSNQPCSLRRLCSLSLVALLVALFAFSAAAFGPAALFALFGRSFRSLWSRSIRSALVALFARYGRSVRSLRSRTIRSLWRCVRSLRRCVRFGGSVRSLWSPCSLSSVALYSLSLALRSLSPPLRSLRRLCSLSLVALFALFGRSLFAFSGAAFAPAALLAPAALFAPVALFALYDRSVRALRPLASREKADILAGW